MGNYGRAVGHKDLTLTRSTWSRLIRLTFLAATALGGCFGVASDTAGTHNAITPSPVATGTQSASSNSPTPPAVPDNTLLPTQPLSPHGEASSEVTDFGSAGYHIPLWVPPGRNGMQPVLSLSYDSADGKGLLGVGWQLTGVPRITRCPKSIYYKSPSSLASVKFDSTDQLCIGNERLVFDGSVYRQAHDDHSIFIAHDPDNMGPTWFEQHTRDGRILYFGKDPGTRLEGDRISIAPDPDATTNTTTTTSVRFGWLVSRVQDRAGNFLSVQYADSADYHRRGLPIQIDYTGSSIDPTTHRSVRFYYEARPDAEESLYISGFPIARTLRLSRIEMWGPNPVQQALLRIFSLGYTTGTTGRSLLQQLSECDQVGGVCRTETFTYTRNDPTFDDIDTGLGIFNDLGRFISVLDIDGDGQDDILYLASDKLWHLATANGSGFTPHAGGLKITDYQPVVADLNGDGRSDLLVRGIADSGLDVITALISTRQPDQSWWFTPTGPQHPIIKFRPNAHEAADLDGNHYPKLVFSDDGHGDQANDRYLWNGTNDQAPVGTFGDSFPQPAVGKPFSPLMYADVNGDKKAVLLSGPPYPKGSSHYQNRFWIYHPGKGQEVPTTLPWQDPTGLTLDSNLLFADFNGDGLNDAVIADVNDSLSNQIAPLAAFNTGAGFKDTQPIGLPTWAGSAHRLIDWNLDGKLDILLRPNQVSTPDAHYPSVVIYQSGQWSWTPTNLPRVTKSTIGDSFEVLDANGDGLDDLVGLSDNGGNGSATLHLYIRKGPKPDLLESATGDFGHGTTFSYLPLDHGSGSQDPRCQVPIHCVYGKLWIVDKHTIDNGIGGDNVYFHGFSSPGFFDTYGGGFLVLLRVS